MPFDWMTPRIPRPWRERWSARAHESTRREIRHHAALLQRLGRSRDQTVARCRQNLRWDYQMHGRPPLLDEVEGLVDEIYGRTLTLDPGSGA